MIDLAINILAAAAIVAIAAIEYRLGYAVGKDVGYEKAKREQMQREAKQARKQEWAAK